jgi:hypothetical protein
LYYSLNWAYIELNLVLQSNLSYSNLTKILNQIYLGVIYTLRSVFCPFFQLLEELIENKIKKVEKKEQKIILF